MRQLKISKSITSRESASLEKYLQEIGKVPTEETGDQTEKQDLEFLKLAVSSNEGQ